MPDPTLSSALQNWGGAPPEPTAIGRALMAAGIYPSSQLPYAKPMFEPGSVGSKLVTEGLPLAMMGVRSGVMKAGPDAWMARALDRKALHADGPSDFGITGGEPNAARWNAAFDQGRMPSRSYSFSSTDLAERPGVTAVEPTWPKRPIGPLSPANGNEPPYPMRTMDPMVTRFLRALDGETPLQVQLPKLTVIEGGLPPRKN